jgi:N-acetylglutamate synthase-like GNAT family acetyltransferase
MIRVCSDQDLERIWAVINDGAQAYRGVIPADRWTEPYMPMEKLRHEIEDGVRFYCFEEQDTITGVMGLQQVQDVTLVRHAYVSTTEQKKGIGGRLLAHLRQLTEAPVLIGTWADATWAIRFYERHGFRMVGPEQKERLLRRYWVIPERQIETSVVLADRAWWELQRETG